MLHQPTDATDRSPRAGFTIIELLVVIAIIGILVAILMPAVQSAREAARRTQCKNNLKQLALGVVQFEELHGAYPPARLQPRPLDTDPAVTCGGEEPTWLVRILPQIEAKSLWDRWDLNAPFRSHSDSERTANLPVFVCPSRRSADAVGTRAFGTAGSTQTITLACGCQTTVTVSGNPVDVTGAVGDYAGNHGDLSPGAWGSSSDLWFGGNGTGVIIGSRAVCKVGNPVSWKDRIRHKDVLDGTSNTAMIGELHVSDEKKLGTFPENPPMYDGDYFGAASRLGGPGMPLSGGYRDYNASPLSFGSWHSGICHFALCDGSVRAVNNKLSTLLLARLTHRSDSEGGHPLP